MISFFCSVCHYDATDPAALSEDQRAERECLTVVDGQMVCMEHMDAVAGSSHAETIVYARKHGRLG